MKKSINKISAFAAALLLLTAFAACDNPQEQTTPDLSVTAEAESTAAVSEETAQSEAITRTAESKAEQSAQNGVQMPDPVENLDADYNDGFYFPGKAGLNGIATNLLNLRDEDEVNEWINSFPPVSEARTSLDEYMNDYSFVMYFDVTEEEAKAALPVYSEHFDAIFSGNVKELISEYTIAVGDNVYCPNWVYTHSAEDYQAAGITPEMLEEKAPLYAVLNLTDEARTAFAKKLSDYVGSEITLPKRVYDSKPEQNIEDGVMEDDYEYIDDDIVEIVEDVLY